MYKPRLFLKNIFPNSNNFCNVSIPNKINVDKALVVSKLTRYECEEYRHKDLNTESLEQKLRNRGADYEKLYDAHNRHKKYEQSMSHTLTKMGINVRVVNRLTYNEECVKWADIIIPTGGDGTFLLAASRVRDNIIPVVGFNSDPNSSEGHLCLPKQYSANIEEAIHRLTSGNFQWLLRNRIRITMVGQKGDIIPNHLHETHNNLEMVSSKLREKGRILPYLALNEVFIGESISAKVSHIDMWLNDELQQTSVKSSGLCVCTGTGSTSWHMSINRLSVQSVAELLRLLDISPTEDKYSLATVLSDLYNKNLIFEPTDRNMAYTIRDLISAGVWPKPKGIKPRGFTKRMKVKSKCFGATLVIDGGVSFAFNDGTVAILEIHPEDALRTVQFVE